jgi:hypothetical protein
MQDPAARKYAEATPEAVAAFLKQHALEVANKARVVTTMGENVTVVVTTKVENEPVVVTTNERVVTTQNDSVVVTTQAVPPPKDPVVVTTNRHGKYSGHRIMLTVDNELYARMKSRANGGSVAAHALNVIEADDRRKRTEF